MLAQLSKMTKQLQLDSLLLEVCITDFGQTVHPVCCHVFIFHVLDEQYTLMQPPTTILQRWHPIK